MRSLDARKARFIARLTRERARRAKPEVRRVRMLFSIIISQNRQACNV